MADIYKYEKPKRSATKEALRSIFLHRFQLIYRGLILLAILVVSGIIIYRSYLLKEYDGYEVISFAQREAIPGTVHKRLGNSILVYSKDGAHGVDAKGEKLWDVTFELQDPRAAISGGCAALYDENGRSLYLVDEKEVLGEIKTTLPIRNAAVSENGIVSALEIDGETTWIYVYNAAGEELVGFKTSMAGSGYPLAIALSPDASLFAVSYLYADRGEFRTSVSFYNFGAVGQNYTDRYVSGYDYIGRVVPMIGFLSSDTIYALSDDRLMIYSGSEIPVSKTEIFLQDRVISAYVSGGYVNLVFSDTSGQAKYRLETYGQDGEKESSVLLDIDYTDIVTGSGSLMAYNSTECRVFSLAGQKKLSATFNSPVLLASPRGRGYRYTLVTSKGIETMRLN